MYAARLLADLLNDMHPRFIAQDVMCKWKPWFQKLAHALDGWAQQSRQTPENGADRHVEVRGSDRICDCAANVNGHWANIHAGV